MQASERRVARDVREERLELPVETLPQPDETTCGPTCLHAVYAYWDDPEPLHAVIKRMRRLDSGGTYAVFLGCDALRKGYKARIYTYNLTVFDPSWFGSARVDIRERLARQQRVKPDPRIYNATEGYLEFLELGGRIRFANLSQSLVARVPAPSLSAADRPVVHVPLPAASRVRADGPSGRHPGRAAGSLRGDRRLAARDPAGPRRRSLPAAPLRSRAQVLARHRPRHRGHSARHRDARCERPRHLQGRSMNGAALLVVDRQADLSMRIPGATVVRARDYLVAGRRRVRSRNARRQPLPVRPLPEPGVLRVPSRRGTRSRVVPRDVHARRHALPDSRRARGAGFRGRAAGAARAARRPHVLARHHIRHRPEARARCARRRDPPSRAGASAARGIHQARRRLAGVARACAVAQRPVPPPARRAGRGLDRLPLAVAGGRQACRAQRVGGDPLQRRRAASAVEPLRAQQVHRRGCVDGDARRDPPQRRDASAARIRRPVHPRHDQRRPLHLRVRATGVGRGPGGDRRSRVDPQVHEQGVPAGAPRLPRRGHAAISGGAQAQRRAHRADARAALRAEATGQRILARCVQGRHPRGARGCPRGPVCALRSPDRPGVAADAVRLARGRARPAPRVRLQVLHGARTLAGREARARAAHRRLDADAARRRGAGGRRRNWRCVRQTSSATVSTASTSRKPTAAAS